MSAKISRIFVVDSCVVRAAGGEEAVFPTSKRCRDFLKDILTICHRVVLTSDIGDEWRKHSSRFSRLWRIQMEARKKICRPNVVNRSDVHEKIKALAFTEGELTAIEKDFMLIEAALTTDSYIASMDDTVKSLFERAALNVGEIRDIVWVNPDNSPDKLSTWLSCGAPPQDELKIRR